MIFESIRRQVSLVLLSLLWALVPMAGLACWLSGQGAGCAWPRLPWRVRPTSPGRLHPPPAKPAWCLLPLSRHGAELQEDLAGAVQSLRAA